MQASTIGQLMLVVVFFAGCDDERGVVADGTADSARFDAGVADRGAEGQQVDVGPGDLVVADAGEASFIGNRSEDLCNSTLPVCKGIYAGCIMDDQHYLSGTFPGERKFVVEATFGQKIRVLIHLSQKLSPGTETEVMWYEPGCTDEHKYLLSQDGGGQDLFQAAGNDSIFEVEHTALGSGDHLVSVWSDAVVKYVLRAEAVN